MRHNVVIIFFLNFFLLITEAYGLEQYRVTEVHDGDSVSIRVSSFIGFPIRTERVRLIGIDAPELKQEPWGRLSKKYLKKLLSENDWVVKVEFDIDKRDQYNRLLAYLWAKNGNLINEKILANGYALLYTVPPNVKYVERFKKAQRLAQQNKRGIWGKSGLKMTPEEWRMRYNQR